MPTSQIALSLLAGFILMLALEQLVIPNSHHIETHTLPQPFKGSMSRPSVSHDVSVEFDAEMDDLERDGVRPGGSIGIPSTPIPLEVGASSVAIGNQQKAFALTAGLVIHSLADGLALGVSALAKAAPGHTNNVSLIVFIALLLHKGSSAYLASSPHHPPTKSNSITLAPVDNPHWKMNGLWRL